MEPPSYGLNAAATAYQGNLPLYLRITDIDEEGRYLRQGRVSVAQSVTNDAFLQQDDIAVARTGASVGKSYFCDGNDGPFVYAGFLIRLRANPKKLLPSLLAQWLRSDEYWRWVTLTSARSGQPGINGTEYASAAIPVPTGPLVLEEQRKIAECLESLDELVSAERNKLDALKRHKKGLLQQLFPAEGETTPRLRFPQFRNSGEWSAGLLSDVSTVVRGGSPRPIDSFITEDSDGLNWLKIGDVDPMAKYIAKTSQKVLRSALSKTRMISPNDLILSNSMSFGRPYISQIHSCIHDGWLAVTKIKASLLSEFAYYLLLSAQSQSFFKNAAAGSGVLNLNLERVTALPISWPAIDEQAYIVGALSTIDGLIEQSSERVTNLRTHKAALMQQLFPSLEELDAPTA